MTNLMLKLIVQIKQGMCIDFLLYVLFKPLETDENIIFDSSRLIETLFELLLLICLPPFGDKQDKQE